MGRAEDYVAKSINPSAQPWKVRRQEDALIAAEVGADAIGLLVGERHNSPDFISATIASDLVRAKWVAR